MTATQSAHIPRPLTKAYWRLAAAEMKNGKMFVFAAMIVALRVALKSVSIPVAADLYIGVGFLANAFGSMVYGPVMALLSGAVSDTLGAVLFPKGTYFLPFILTEMAGSLIYALFLYRSEITVRRVILCKFTVNLAVNIVMTTPIMWLYYRLVMGRNYEILNMMRILKNLVLFPIEAVVLTLFLRLMLPAIGKMYPVRYRTEKLRFDRKSVLTLAVTFLFGCACVAGYYIHHYNTTSLSASYTAEQRAEKNAWITGLAVPEADREKTAAVIDRADARFGQREVTYSFTLYDMDRELMEAEGITPGDVLRMKPSEAGKSACLAKTGAGTLVADKSTDEAISLEILPEAGNGH